MRTGFTNRIFRRRNPQHVPLNANDISPSLRASRSSQKPSKEKPLTHEALLSEYQKVVQTYNTLRVSFDEKKQKIQEITVLSSNPKKQWTDEAKKSLLEEREKIASVSAGLGSAHKGFDSAQKVSEEYKEIVKLKQDTEKKIKTLSSKPHKEPVQQKELEKTQKLLKEIQETEKSKGYALMDTLKKMESSLKEYTETLSSIQTGTLGGVRKAQRQTEVDRKIDYQDPKEKQEQQQAIADLSQRFKKLQATQEQQDKKKARRS